MRATLSASVMASSAGPDGEAGRSTTTVSTIGTFFPGWASHRTVAHSGLVQDLLPVRDGGQEHLLYVVSYEPAW